MAVISRNWLYLAEGYTGSRATAEALLNLPGTESVGSHHETWPSLASKNIFIGLRLTFSVVRHPLDIIATIHAKNDRNSIPYELIRRYRHRDSFFMHRCDKTICYERGLSKQISRTIMQYVDIPIKHKTPNKKPWQDLFTKEDYKFALATIPELFTLGYVSWDRKANIRAADIDDYLENHGEQS